MLANWDFYQAAISNQWLDQVWKPRPARGQPGPWLKVPVAAVSTPVG